jgi:protein-S-isoprenylcysteine O-methyltransferase Ste14
MKALFHGIRAVIYAAGFIAVFWWIALDVRVFDQDIGGPLPQWIEIPGIILMILGGGLALVCLAVFVMRGRGTAAPFDPPTQFVAIGPYRFVRNPMYIGGLGMLFGFGLYLRSASVLVFAVVVTLLLQIFVVHSEEWDLERRFGESYLEYKNSVNRWIPTWKKRDTRSK